MNIIIMDDFQDAVRKLDCIRKLEGLPYKIFTNNVKGTGQLAVRLRDADIIIPIRERTVFNEALLSKLPRLRMIAQTGRLGNHIDLDACTRLGIAVAQGSGSPRAPAELTWGLVLSAMRRIPQYVGHLKHGAWQQSGLRSASMPANFSLGSNVYGKMLGIWGYGQVGKIVAGYGRAFGMHVKVWASDGSLERARADGYETFANRQALFEESDVLSVHLRLLDTTRHLVTLNDLASMKPTALFVNTSRAELVAENALVTALNRGRPGMAAVDVFESEPILQGHPLLRLENCICSPHIGYVELQNYEHYFGQAFDQVLRFLQNDFSELLNPDALKVKH